MLEHLWTYESTRWSTLAATMNVESRPKPVNL